MNENEFFQELQKKRTLPTLKQKKAITHVHGPAAVYAGPGSGKTTVITLRAVYLCQVKKVPPGELVVFTFSRKSAAELKNRLHGIAEGLSKVTVGTFHSLFLRWLLKYKNLNPRILSGSDQRLAMREVLKSLNMSVAEEQVQRYMQWVSQLKNRLIHPVSLRVKDPQNEQIKQVFSAYEDFKNLHGRWDFDDILCHFYHSLVQDASFLQRVRDMCTYVMIDEFQDTSRAQWLSIKTLCKDGSRLLVVGDDDQSIYRFRGAEPQIMQEFLTTFAGATEVVLSENFRSVDPIISLASRLIDHNVKRKQKFVTGVLGGGVKPDVTIARDEWAEADHVARKVESLLVKRETGTIGILARTNQQLLCVVETLFRRKVGFSMDDETYVLYREFHVQTALQFLRAAHSPKDVNSARQALASFARWNRVSGAKALEDIKDGFLSVEDFMSYLRERTDVTVFSQFCVFIERLADSTPDTAVRLIRQNQEAYLRKISRRAGAPISESLSALHLLEQRARGEENASLWLANVDRMLQMKAQSAGGERLQVMTFHGAKGLEFDTVFLVGLHDLAVPHVRSLDDAPTRLYPEVLEEERRLLYVGITRAKTGLHLSYPLSGSGQSARPSRFLGEIGFLFDKKTAISKAASRAIAGGPELPLPERGSELIHRLFGRGIVQSIEPIEDNGHKIGIIFDRQDLRYFYWEVAAPLGHFTIGSQAGKGNE